MVLEVPLWTAGPEGDLYQHSALLDRRALDAIYSDAGVLRPVTGALQVTQRGAGANMSVDVAAGSCVIAGTSAPNQGKYLCRSTATENVIVPSPSGPGTRIDIIVATVKDSEVSGLDDGFFIELHEDTELVPINSVPLATVAVTSNAVEITNANITDIRPEALQHGQNPRGTIQMWSGTIATIPKGWQLCDGTNGTPNLRDRFVVGAGDSYETGNTGGANTVTLTTSQIPSHNHSGPSHTHGSGSLSTGSAGTHDHVLRLRQLNATTSHNHSGTSTRVSQSHSTSPFTDLTDSAAVNNSGSHTHSVTSGSTSASGTGSTGNTGSGNSHENRPPYFALAYIMFMG